MKIDLHGMPIHQAWKHTLDTIEACYHQQVKKLIVVTGKSGQICQEFPFWVEKSQYVRTFSMNENKGSWTIRIKKKS
jgi:DNA-nicking Smr family endonuclease